ncbi:hypothetical protein [uncultured Roseobacter sp.]|uniref:hypothetical protein n=1 Tax=uncultured Roseobacter sp. TaxID=114847 RepID=UPI002630A818|nr:hypothetical protein [uncultured Roseobacter sp.]
MAAVLGRNVTTDEIVSARMANLPMRAHWEDAPIERVATETVRKHAPSIWCSAVRLRNDILDAARELVHSSGWLVYATSSVLRCENEGRIAAFLHRNTQ